MFEFTEPVGFTIFCDDIRQEIGNKESYIGVYAGAMLIHVAFPVTLQKFGFHVFIFEPVDTAIRRDFPIKISIYLPGDAEDQPSLSAEIPADPEAARAGLDNLPWKPSGKYPVL